MRLARLLAFSLVALALLGSAIATGKLKPFKPKIGTYSGTSKVDGTTAGANGAVVNRGGGIAGVSVYLHTTSTCDDGASTAVELAISAEVKGKTFSYSGGGGDDLGGYYHYKLQGRFTSPTAFTGTASREGVTNPSEHGSPRCTTGAVSFSFHKK